MSKEQDSMLSEIESALDHLLENAKHLNEISTQVISGEELKEFQSKQDHLLQKLSSLDQKFQQKFNSSYNDVKSPITKKIQEKLRLFQKYNQELIQNISSSKGLIQFEKAKIKRLKKGN